MYLLFLKVSQLIQTNYFKSSIAITVKGEEVYETNLSLLFEQVIRSHIEGL